MKLKKAASNNAVEPKKFAKKNKIINKIKKDVKQPQNAPKNAPQKKKNPVKAEVKEKKQQNIKPKKESVESSELISKGNANNDKGVAIELDEKAGKGKVKKLAKKLKKMELANAQPEASIQKPNNDTDAFKEFSERDPLATIFVGNLPITTKRVQIKKLFAKAGQVVVQSIRLRTAAGHVIFKHKQRKEAQSLNAYVVFKDAESAKKALELNGIEFKNNNLRITPVDIAEKHAQDAVKRTLFVGNLKHSANENKLRDIFSNCGEIDYIRCLGNGKNGCKGVAFVCFKSPEAIGLALELNETLLDDRPMHLERYSKKKLGAKEARDKQAGVIQKPKPTGAKKRINDKQQNNGTVEKTLEKKKKTDFHGVKANGIKKQKNTKKPNSEMKGLAKKIAPKIKKKSVVKATVDA